MQLLFNLAKDYLMQYATWVQCDQIKIAKFLLKLPKNIFTRNMIDFDTFTKNA